jgi:hypothetical protein
VLEHIENVFFVSQQSDYNYAKPLLLQTNVNPTGKYPLTLFSMDLRAKGLSGRLIKDN